jgi:hypothetical protein
MKGRSRAVGDDCKKARCEWPCPPFAFREICRTFGLWLTNPKGRDFTNGLRSVVRLRADCARLCSKEHPTALRQQPSDESA